MALALSASLAAKESQDFSAPVTIPDTTFKAPSSLPVLPPPEPKEPPRAKKSSSSKTKTALQVRTDQERENQISARVANILVDGCGTVFPFSGPRVILSASLCGNVNVLDTETCRWRAAGMNEVNYLTEFVQGYTDEEKPGPPDSSSDRTKSEVKDGMSDP